jgi:hypothetical protein
MVQHMSDEKVRQAIADHDAAHPYWRQEKREREIREAKEAEARRQSAYEARRQAEQQHRQLMATNNSKVWCDWVDQRIAQYIEQLMGRNGPSPLIDGLGRGRSNGARGPAPAIDEAKRAFETKLTATQKRISPALAVLNERLKSTNALGERVSQESADWRKEFKQALEESQQALEETKPTFEPRLAALEERLRAEARKESQLGIAGERRAVDAKLETCARALSRHCEQGIEESRRAVDAKLAAMEQRLRAVPGKLPVAKTWRSESVTYEAEYASLAKLAFPKLAGLFCVSR